MYLVHKSSLNLDLNVRLFIFFQEGTKWCALEFIYLWWFNFCGFSLPTNLYPQKKKIIKQSFN